MEPEALPEHIGPYRITGRLGRGGMGEVLSGHDDRLDRPVALKRVRPGGRDPEKARQRFRREARVLARLSHPAIVQVYDWEEAVGDDWLVMELVDGRPLDAVLEDGPLPPERAMAVAREVASGLAVAHEAGLVHRDLKAANVMVTEGGGRPDRIKILDFGIAKKVELETGEAAKGERLTTLTGAGQVVGTVASMSPEQALGYPVDHRSDLFSLGILLYEMLSGVSPFEGGSKVETLSRICSARETPLRDLDPGLPAGLAGLVGRLLEKQPERRPGDAREVVAELDRLPATSSVSDTTLRPAMGQPGEAGQDDATLEMGMQQLPPPAPQAAPAESAESEEDHGTYASPRVTLGWGVALAAAVLIAVGLWGASLWMSSKDDEIPDIGTPATSARLPEVELSSHELYQRGTTLLERYDLKGNIDKAITDFQRALALDESYAPALAGLANAYSLDFFRGSQDPQRLEQALAAAERAEQAGEHLAIAHVSLGMVYVEMGRFEDAVRQLERALEIEPLNSDALLGLGKVSESRSDLPQAEDHFQRAITTQPDNWVFHSYLGSLYFHTGRYNKAEVAFLRHLEITPDSFVAFRNLGATYYMEGRLAEAATQFQQSLQIQPDPTVFNNLGTIYFAQGLYAQSVSAFKKAVDSGGSNDHELWGNLGDGYRWTPGSEPLAREAYLRATQLLTAKLAANPRDATLRTRLVTYLAKRGDCKQATADIATIGALPRDDGNAWFQLAIANEICDHRAGALTALEVALQAGYSIEDVQRDPELLKLRQDVGYHRLAMKLKPGGGF